MDDDYVKLLVERLRDTKDTGGNEHAKALQEFGDYFSDKDQEAALAAYDKALGIPTITHETKFCLITDKIILLESMDKYELADRYLGILIKMIRRGA